MNLLIVTHQLPGIILVVFQTARISSQAVVAVVRLLKASEVSFWSDSSLSFKIKGKDDIVVRGLLPGDLGPEGRDDDRLFVEGELVVLELGGGLLWGAVEGATEIVAGYR